MTLVFGGMAHFGLDRTYLFGQPGIPLSHYQLSNTFLRHLRNSNRVVVRSIRDAAFNGKLTQYGFYKILLIVVKG